jgi:hypothetical protein
VTTPIVFTELGEILLPENAPVRATSAQLAEPDYRNPHEAYSTVAESHFVTAHVLPLPCLEIPLHYINPFVVLFNA